MNIELLGWQVKGLRCPDAEVKLFNEHDRVPRITLIQMPNGTGKTTTLSCLRAAMDGSAESWSNEQVLSYRDSADPAEEGLFMATLRINGTQRLVVEMTFHFSEGAVTYRTTSGSRISEGYSPPPDVRRYLDPRFSELLFFDGELANDLVSGAKDVNASKVIDTFYGLHHLEDLRAQAQKNYELYVQNRKAASREAEITKKYALKAKLVSREQSVRTILSKNRTRRGELRKQIDELDTAISSRLLQSKKFQAEERKALGEREAAEGRKKDLIHQVDSEFPNPLFLAPTLRAKLTKLADNLDTLMLPETTSRAFFDDLVKQAMCICGRPMDDHAKKSIEGKAETILGDQINGFLNELKRAVRRQCAGSPVRDFDSMMTDLINADDDVVRADSILKDIRERAASEDEEDIAADTQKLDALKNELNIVVRTIEEGERPTRPGDKEDCNCLDYFEKKLNQLDNEIAELTGSLERKRRTELLMDVIGEAYKEAHDLLKIAVITEANAQLKSVLPYNPVQISDINNSVRVQGKSGVSVGQGLSVGYVFLAGLLHGGGNQFPFVVDSPAGPLDDQARRNLGLLLPKLVKQFVGFVIPTERQYFVEPLEQAAGNDVLFLTQLRLNEHTKGRIPDLGGQRLHESSNGIILGGRDPFMRLGDDTNGDN